MNYHMDQESLLSQIAKIHKKLGFCPVTLILSDFEKYNLHHSPEKLLTEEVVYHYLKGTFSEGINYPFMGWVRIELSQLASF